ncbi:hypothetical protein [Nonomuraea soli]|uniref:Uncharacterized protein n=1 Tax=Nonomuraea soli TaxID=1032476 RepID=A0A7W0HN87_9ACTN|nr:hypothetical protein [Nonomuraea soli]MBA2889271.1 hypothetical protein [Nonomuraea soli]NUT41328.1 hypothetical protein [Thermoactinospora sp.]
MKLDIRQVIGGLFLLYGVILIAVGLIGGEAPNLWTGAAMAVFGGAFLAWARLKRI